MYGVAPSIQSFMRRVPSVVLTSAVVPPMLRGLIQYALYITSLKLLDLPFGEGALIH